MNRIDEMRAKYINVPSLKDDTADMGVSKAACPCLSPLIMSRLRKAVHVIILAYLW